MAACRHGINLALNGFMDATKFLRDNHKILRGLFTQLETSGLRAPEMKEGVRRQLWREFKIHSQLEEEIFYPALREELGADQQGKIDDAINIHHEAEFTFHDASDRFDEFRDLVLAHIDDEELHLFTLAERIFSAEVLDELGAKLHQRHDELTEFRSQEQSAPEQTQNPHGGEQKRKKSVA